MARRSYQPKDHYFRKAKAEGFRARSAFKLEEIAARHRLLRAGQVVVDLGAAPGGFLQVIADAVGTTGQVLGVDIVPIRPLGRANVTTAVLDVLAPTFLDALAALHPGPYDVVVSDMAPKTTGVKVTDEARSVALVRSALAVSTSLGKPGSAFIAKLFMGSQFEALRGELKAHFGTVKVVRPEATRGASMEIYLVGIGLRRPPGAHAGPRPGQGPSRAGEDD